VHGLHQTHHRLGYHFGPTRRYSYVMGIKCKLVSVHFEIVLISMQDRCTVCADVPWASKSFWGYPIKLAGDVGQVEARFGLFGDSVNLSARQEHGWR
jgi:hypothetical protein